MKGQFCITLSYSTTFLGIGLQRGHYYILLISKVDIACGKRALNIEHNDPVKPLQKENVPAILGCQSRRARIGVTTRIAARRAAVAAAVRSGATRSGSGGEKTLRCTRGRGEFRRARTAGQRAAAERCKGGERPRLIGCRPCIFQSCRLHLNLSVHF